MKSKIIKNVIIIIISILMCLAIPNYQYAKNIIMLGDINKDNVVDSRDQLLIMRHIMASARKTHPEWILTGDNLKLADVTQNGKVDNSDMLKILRYIAAKRNPEKIGNKHKEWLDIGEIDLEPKQPEVEPESTPEVPAPKPQPEPKTIEVSSITLNKTTLSLDMSGTKTATLIETIEPNNATNKSITYSTSNEKIATVDKNGKITAKGNGTATITAKTSNGKTATSKVTVTTSPTRIKLNNTSITKDIVNSKNIALKATVEPNTASNKKVTWSSSNTKVATVDNNGNVTAKISGTATITAKTANGKTAKCTLKLKNDTKFSLSYIEHMRQKMMYYGSKTNYGCVIDLDRGRVTIFKAANKDKTEWNLAKDSNGNYITWYAYVGVDEPGHGGPTEQNTWVGPRSKSHKGAFRVVGRKKHGNNFITCYVPYKHDSPYHKCQGLHAWENGTYPEYRSAKNRHRTEGCTCVTPEQSTWVYKNVPDNSTVLVFDDYNPMPAWSQTGDMSPYAPANRITYDVPETISLDKKKVELKNGKTTTLKVSTKAYEAFYSVNNKSINKTTNKGFKWSSSNTNVATVDKNGKITAKGKGTATITVSTLGKKATCTVTVK